MTLPKPTLNTSISDDYKPTVNVDTAGIEYAAPVSEATLRNLYVGYGRFEVLGEAAKPPFRCFAFDVRPDILCGSVMESVQSSCLTLFGAVVVKRQGPRMQIALGKGVIIDAQVVVKRRGLRRCVVLCAGVLLWTTGGTGMLGSLKVWRL